MSKYRSGFCGVGLCEGTRPISPSGKPMKVCVFVDTCSCECHSKITAMYKMADQVRLPQQNPEYVPATSPDLSWLSRDEDILAASSLAGSTVSAPRERPSEELAGTWKSDRVFNETPTGVRARGQLEEQVRDVCNDFAAGDIEGPLTPKLIGSSIDKDMPPSTGAIGAVLKRWDSIGFALVKAHPVRFVSYTPAGMEHGLEYLKNAAKRKAKQSVRPNPMGRK